MKKLFQLFQIIMIAVCACVMAACSDGSGAGTGTGEIDTNRYVYREFDLKFDLKDGEDYIFCAYLKDNDFYYVSYSYPDYDDDETEWTKEDYLGKLHLYKTESGEDTVLCDIEDPSDLSGLYVTEQNQIKLLYNMYIVEHNADEDPERDIMVTKTVDGNTVSTVSIADNLGAFLGGSYDVSDMKFEQDGQLYVTCKEAQGYGKYIVKCDIEANVTGSVQVNGDFDRIFADNEKRMAIAAYTGDGIECTYIDFEKGQLGEPFSIQDEEDVYSFGTTVHGGGETARIYNGYGDVTCYIKDTAGLCAYNAKEQTITPLFEWTDTGMIGGFVDNILTTGDGRMFCMCMSRGLFETAGFIERLEEGKERKVIRCAALSTENDYLHTLEKKIIDYNKKSDDYRVELVSYEKSGSPINAFAKDVIEGNIPDVVDISGVDVASYISRGFFEDLAPYMENDDKFGKDYYVDGLYDAISVDGKQFYAIESFGFVTVAAKASDTEQYKDGWTLKDMIDYYHSKPEGTNLYMYESKKEIFDVFVAPFIDDYIDWDTGKVNFDSDEFRAAAAFCNEFPSDYEFGIDYNDVAKQMREGTMLINLLPGSTGTMGEYQLNRALYDGDLRCIGFPSAGKTKAYIQPMSASLAITASSEEKEGAWDFLKSAITDSEQDLDYYHIHDGIPSGKKQFEKVIRWITATEKYTDEDGNVVRPLSGSSGYNSFEFDIRPFKEDETDVIRGLIKDSVVKNDNTSVLLIVELALDSYFRGDNTLDETVSVLQDRVGKYVNENR